MYSISSKIELDDSIDFDDNGSTPYFSKFDGSEHLIDIKCCLNCTLEFE